VSRLKIK